MNIASSVSKSIWTVNETQSLGCLRDRSCILSTAMLKLLLWKSFFKKLFVQVCAIPELFPTRCRIRPIDIGTGDPSYQIRGKYWKVNALILGCTYPRMISSKHSERKWCLWLPFQAMTLTLIFIVFKPLWRNLKNVTFKWNANPCQEVISETAVWLPLR